MNRFAALALSLLVSCAPVQRQTTPPSRAASIVQALPPMQAFTTNYVVPSTRANAQIAKDFLDLSFQMESGNPVPYLTRFSDPITVRIAGPASESLYQDLQALLTRLRREAGIDIILTNAPEAAITIEAVPQRTLKRAVPNAACFVVPRITSWSEFIRKRNTPVVDWTTLTHRENAAIFVPSDSAPQEIRDCLHEELAQALGPLNDLYRLSDSVFNDDNIHTVLTGFDMLVLRTYYAPELTNGMTRDQVADRLPALLARLNPSGQFRQSDPQTDTPRDWLDAIQTALSSGSSTTTRRQAAQRAIALGQHNGWTGPREGFAHYAYGRLQVSSDPNAAFAAFHEAEKAYGTDPSMSIHNAHIAVQKSAFALAAGDAEATLGITDIAIPVAARHQNAALMSTLMMFKAEALAMTGRNDAAATVRLDSLGWARYGFGSDQNVQARLAEISALRPF